MKKETIIIRNSIDELPVLAARIEELSELWEWPMPLTMNINLVLEEAITNVIFYAFPDKQPHDIVVALSCDNQILSIDLTDDGLPFDPTIQQQPDISLPAEDRPIGGLGIFLIRKIMDEVAYQRIGNQNHLLLTKKIS